MNMTSESPMAPPRSWWSRNWAWVVPVGCLGLLLSCGCLGALIAGIAYKTLGDNPVQLEAVQRARQSPEVREALGEPLETSMPRQYAYHTGPEGGSATLVLPLKGPKGEGQLSVRAHKEGDQWIYTTLQVEVLGEPPIDLLDETPGPRPARPPPEGRPELAPVEPLPEDDAAPEQEPEDPKEVDL